MKLSQLLNIEKYDIEGNNRRVCLHFIGDEKITYSSKIDSVDSKYLGLEVVETSKVGKDYLIGLDVHSEFQEGVNKPICLVKDLLEKVDSLVILRFKDYKSYFNLGFNEVNIYRGAVGDAFESTSRSIKSFLESPISLAEIYTTRIDDRMFIVVSVKRVTNNG